MVIPVGGQLTRPVNLDQQYTPRSFLNYSLPLDFTLSSNSSQSYVRNPLPGQVDRQYFRQNTSLRAA